MRNEKKVVKHASSGVAQKIKLNLGLALSTANQWLLKEADARRWRWTLIREHWPAEMIPRGTLVDCLPNDPLVQKLHEMRCAVVRLGRLPHPDDHALPAVLPDLRAQGELAADHFHERGFQDVGYFGHSPWGDAQYLYEGFSKRAKVLNMTCHLYQIKRIRKEPASDSTERQNREFAAWVRDVPKPVGLLAPGDFVASTFCNLTIQAGFNVPEDVAILGRGNRKELCECMMPSISSIDVNEKERWHTACDILEKLMNGNAQPTTPVMIPPKMIVERESTSVLATPDKQVATALRFMWDNLEADISVVDIARAAGLSTRHLKRRFRNALNRGIIEELRRKRLEELKQLLRSTRYPIAELAPLVGFRSATYLHRSFREAFGMTPAQYRKARDKRRIAEE